MPGKRYFPRQLFKRFLISQLFTSIPLLILFGVIARLYLGSKLSGSVGDGEALRSLNFAFFVFIVAMAASFSLISLWMAYQLVLPLGRIIVRARAILKKEYRNQREDEDAPFLEEAQGEWSDLETALNRIERNMLSQDLSLSREREEIEAIMSAVTEAVIAVDREGNLLFFNSQFAVLFADGDIRRRQSRISDFFRDPDILDTIRSTLRDGTPRNVSSQITLKNELAPRHFSLSVAPLKLRDGSAYGAVCVFHDVSELKRTDQVRIDFVANVSHELRTPLTSIKGYAQTLRQDMEQAGNASALKFLTTIERNADRLIALVNDLLNLSSLESGELDLERQTSSTKEITERVLSQLDSLRGEKRQRLDAVYAAKSVYADPKRLEQVLFNLVENAIKYAPLEKNIQVCWEEGPGETLLRVADDGPGIAPEHHTRLFERFYRVDYARNREQGGTGLGLAIVKHIMQRHGGKVRVHGGPGIGTEFICSFPKEKN